MVTGEGMEVMMIMITEGPRGTLLIAVGVITLQGVHLVMVWRDYSPSPRRSLYGGRSGRDRSMSPLYSARGSR